MANLQPPAQVPPLPQLPANYLRRFDPQAQLPARLQLRIDRWQTDPPKSQFQAYGPLDGYFHAKFPSNFFLVKPQAFLSGVHESDPESDNSEPRGHRRIDSQGVAVGDKRRYPDFNICQFFGANADGTPADTVRVVYEVGSKKTDAARRDIYRQLEQYLDLLTPMRFDGWVLGVAQIQNEVLLLKNTSLNTAEFEPLPTAPLWMSLFDPRFVQELNWMRDWSYTNDNTLVLRG